MILSELNQLLSTLLADSSNNFYSEPERLQALNSACSYINSELRILRTVAEITVTPVDEGHVALPANFISMGLGVQWKNAAGQVTNLNHSVPFKLQSGLSSSWQTDEGIPSTYVLEGANVYITPIPKETGIVVLSYVAAPNKLINDNDLPFYGDLRVQAYHDMIAFYAAWQLCLKDRDFEAAQTFMQYFQARLIDLKENLRHTGNIVQPVWSDTYAVT